MLYIFGKLSSSQFYTPHLTCSLTQRRTVFEIFSVKILDFGVPWGTPKTEEDLSGTYIIMQNFTPIGGTIAEISGAAERHRKKELQQI